MVSSAIEFGVLRATVPAAGFVYKLRGSSQPSIIRGEDGDFYVVKSRGFPGVRGLFNEALGTELIKSLGLPTPDWVPISISEDFIDRNPGMWFQLGSAPIRPIAGMHFGSRMIQADGEQRTYQMIPHIWTKKIKNRDDFVGMLVLDLWANNCDRRQAVFLGDKQSGLQAFFIDNDFMFGGKFGFEVTCPRRAMVHDLGIYTGLWTRQRVEKWQHMVGRIDDGMIERIIGSVPAEWADTQTRLEVAAQLRVRRTLLPAMLDDAENTLKNSYTLKCDRARFATEPSPFRFAPVPLAKL